MHFRVIAFMILPSLLGHCSGEPPIQRCDPMPKIVTTAQPDLPPQLHHFFGGSIVVEFVIEKSGKLRNPLVVESDIEHQRAQVLYDAVYETMTNSWRYVSRSKACRGRITMQFKLVD